jgi:hypothetical protein
MLIFNFSWPLADQARGQGIRLSEHLDGDGGLAFRHACRMGLDGIVPKRRDRPYRSGRCGLDQGEETRPRRLRPK